MLNACSDRALLDDLQDVVYERDLDGRILMINAAGERLFGRQRADIIGNTLHGSLQDEAWDSLQATNQRLISHGEDRSTVTMCDAGGSERVLECVTTLVVDAAGSPIGARGVMRDVTERVRLEIELRRQAVELAALNAALQRADRAKAHLVSMVVHDLRTPLTVLTAGLDVLASNGSGGQVMDMACKSAEQMAHLIDEVLELYRPHDGPTLTTLVQVQTLLDTPLRAARLVAERRGVQIALDLEPDLPGIELDLARVQRAIANLLANAVKYSPDHGTVTVAGHRLAGQGGLEIAVLDAGDGIAAEELPRLFDAYFQASNARGRHGSGLGLAIVKRIVEAHGGSVAVASRPGHGSRFALRLPLAPVLVSAG